MKLNDEIKNLSHGIIGIVARQVDRWEWYESSHYGGNFRYHAQDNELMLRFVMTRTKFGFRFEIMNLIPRWGRRIYMDYHDSEGRGGLRELFEAIKQHAQPWPGQIAGPRVPLPEVMNRLMILLAEKTSP